MQYVQYSKFSLFYEHMPSEEPVLSSKHMSSNKRMLSIKHVSECCEMSSSNGKISEKHLNEQEWLEIICKLSKPNAPAKCSLAHEYNVSEGALVMFGIKEMRLNNVPPWWLLKQERQHLTNQRGILHKSRNCWRIKQRNLQMEGADNAFMKWESSKGFKAQMKHYDNLT